MVRARGRPGGQHLHPGRVPDAPRPRRPASSSPHDKVRVRAAPLGGGFGGKLMVIDPLPVAAALKLRRPVRLALTRSEDFAASNPAPGQILELEAGASADGTLTGVRGRVVCDRGMNEEYGVESISGAARDRPLPLAGPRRRRLRRAHQPRHVGRLPRSRRAAGRVRDRDAARRAGGRAGDRPARAAPRQRAARGRPRDGRQPDAGRSAPTSASSACASTRCGRAAASCPRTRASAWRSAGGPAASSRRRRPAGSTTTAR